MKSTVLSATKQLSPQVSYATEKHAGYEDEPKRAEQNGYVIACASAMAGTVERGSSRIRTTLNNRQTKRSQNMTISRLDSPKLRFFRI